MKRFYIFGKFMLKLIFGGLIGFVVCTVALFMKGYNIASDMARDMSIVASEDGCVNFDTMNTMMSGFKNTYSSSTNNIDNDDDYMNGTDEYGGAKYFIFDYRGSYPDNYSQYIQVNDSNGNSIVNMENHDYKNHVQRGNTINIVATAHIRLYLPFKLLNKNDASTNSGITNEDWTKQILNGEFQLTATKHMTCVSTKFFKGELD